MLLLLEQSDLHPYPPSPQTSDVWTCCSIKNYGFCYRASAFSGQTWFGWRRAKTSGSCLYVLQTSEIYSEGVYSTDILRRVYGGIKQCCICLYVKEFLGNLDNKTWKNFIGLPLLKPCTTIRFDAIILEWSCGKKKPPCTRGRGPGKATPASGWKSFSPSPQHMEKRASTTGTVANGKYLGLKPSMKQIPWHGSEIFAPDGPPGLLVNPVLRLCHKEA